MIDWKTIIEGAIVLGSLGYNIYTAKSKRRLDSADYAGKVAKAAAGLIEPYERRLKQLENQVDALEKNVIDLLAGIDLLIGQVEKLGHRPIWRPKKK